MSTNTDHLQELRNKLLEFETCLETPIISGEMEPWAEAASESFATMRSLLTEQILHVHPTHYRQMFEEDPALERHIEQLKQEDEALQKELGVVGQLLQQVHAPLQADPRRETFAGFDAGDLIKTGIALVIRARTQLTAIDTWLNEAFQRERGNVD